LELESDGPSVLQEDLLHGVEVVLDKEEGVDPVLSAENESRDENINDFDDGKQEEIEG